MLRSAFLAKTAFIGNLFFLLCLYLQHKAFAGAADLVSLVAILGIILGMFIANPISNLINGILLFQGKPLLKQVPLWLAITNFCFLLFQIYYLLRIWS